MRGGALPPALLAAALGFVLSFAPRSAIAPSLAVFVLLGAAVSLVRLDPAWADAIFYACWASLIVTALSVHLTKWLSVAATVMLAANVGLWAGAVTSVSGVPLDLGKSLPWILLFLPGRWLIGRKLGIGLKVVASWLVAVAVLGAALPATTPTPGYVGYHLE